jgi:hypothetical protein
MKNEIKLMNKMMIAMMATLTMAFRCGSEEPPMPTDIGGGSGYDAGVEPDTGVELDAGVEIDGGFDVDGGPVADGGFDDAGQPVLGLVYPHFVSPPNFTEVARGTNFVFTVSGVQIVPREIVGAGEGYFVLSIDSGCVAANEVAPNDARHLHLENGETEMPLSLSVGSHVLCLQVAWRDGRVYDGRARLTTYMF